MESEALILGGCIIMAALVLRSSEHTVWHNWYRAFVLFQGDRYRQPDNDE